MPGDRNEDMAVDCSHMRRVRDRGALGFWNEIGFISSVLMKDTRLESSAEQVWVPYLQCLHQIVIVYKNERTTTAIVPLSPG